MLHLFSVGRQQVYFAQMRPWLISLRGMFLLTSGKLIAKYPSNLQWERWPESCIIAKLDFIRPLVPHLNIEFSLNHLYFSGNRLNMADGFPIECHFSLFHNNCLKCYVEKDSKVKYILFGEKSYNQLAISIMGNQRNKWRIDCYVQYKVLPDKFPET